MQFFPPIPSRFRQLKAARYKIVEGFICPDSDDISELSVDNEALLRDYLALIGRYVNDAPLHLEAGGYMPPANLRAQYEKQRDLMTEEILRFCSTWGLFGLYNDQAYPIRTVTDSNGVTITHGDPVRWMMYRNPYDLLFGEAVEVTNANYTARFRLPADPPDGRAFFQHYSESIVDILMDPRITATARYIDDSANARPAFMPSERITLLLDNGAVRPSARSLNMYCQTLFVLDQAKGSARSFEICRHCKQPFLLATGERKRTYCSTSCMQRARDLQYRLRRKERRESGQQTQ